MISQIEQSRGALPAGIDPVEVALEASTSDTRAAAVIAASWALAEAWTGQNFWPVTAAACTGEFNGAPEALWPRYPYPAAIVAEQWGDGGWQAATGVEYVPDLGRIMWLTPGLWRFTQTGTVTPAAPGAHVLEAVRALALYQLIQSPARREFRTIAAADSSLTREAVAGVIAGSGAGMLLAGEVRW